MGHPAVVSIRGLSKTFPGTRALTDLSLDICSGEVHALLGKNGSGKSTLFKVLSGYHAPDPGGELIVDGVEVELPLSVADPTALGFSFVHQDLGLVDSFSVLENIRVGHYESAGLSRIKWRPERRRVSRLLEEYGLNLRPETRVGELSPAERAGVAISRAIQPTGGRRVLLVLDEPTAYLPAPEIGRLFAVIRRLRDSGVAVLFATHRLDEVLEIADRASVLRDGRLVGTFDVASTTEDQLIEVIVGGSVRNLYPSGQERPRGSVALAVEGLRAKAIDGLSFAVRKGEVLGLTGLVGMGHDDVPAALFGAHPAEEGVITVNGTTRGPVSPREALRMGIAYLPANRLRESGIPMATLRENISLPVLGGYFTRLRIDRGAEQRQALGLLDKFEVVPGDDPERRLSTLSGGNQQKALLAKWMQIPQLRVLLLHEPTQGVDVGARKLIFEFIRQAADAGVAIVISSSEYEDLAHLCDRVLVMRRGRLAAELVGSELTEDHIAERCYRAPSNGATEAAVVEPH